MPTSASERFGTTIDRCLNLGDQFLFRTLTDKLIESIGVDKNKQCLDSTAVRSGDSWIDQTGDTLPPFQQHSVPRFLTQSFITPGTENRDRPLERLRTSGLSVRNLVCGHEFRRQCSMLGVVRRNAELGEVVKPGQDSNGLRRGLVPAVISVDAVPNDPIPSAQVATVLSQPSSTSMLEILTPED